MATNSKRTDQLPDRYDDMNADVQILIADRRMARRHVVDRIRDHVPVQIDGTPDDDDLAKIDWARMFRWSKPSDRSARSIRNDHNTADLRAEVADALGYTMDQDRDRVPAMKVELIRLWLTVSDIGNGQDNRHAERGMQSI